MPETLNRLRGAKVLVTGASGFIGRRLVAALDHLGAEITALGRTRHSRKALGGANVRFIAGDLGDARAVAEAVAGQDVIFNLAYDFRQSAADNIAAFEVLVGAAEREGHIRIVHASSIVVYDGWPGGILTEASPMERAGGSPYRRAKIAMEKRLMAGKCPAAVLQPTIVWGPGSSLWTDGFAEALIKGSVVLPDPEGMCQGVFVEDVVQACLRAAVLRGLGRERFIINGPHPFHWSELIKGYRGIIGHGDIRHEPASKLAPPVAHGEQADGDTGPSAAAKISAVARRLIGRERFEAIVRGLRRRMSKGGEMRPDAHLFELYVANGSCPPDAARQRLGYVPAFGLNEGLAATAGHLRALAGRG